MKILTLLKLLTFGSLTCAILAFILGLFPLALLAALASVLTIQIVGSLYHHEILDKQTGKQFRILAATVLIFSVAIMGFQLFAFVSDYSGFQVLETIREQNIQQIQETNSSAWG